MSCSCRATEESVSCSPHIQEIRGHLAAAYTNYRADICPHGDGFLGMKVVEEFWGQ